MNKFDKGRPMNDIGMSLLGNQSYIEVDSDVNEDADREVQLDESFEAWYRTMDQQIRQKDELTNIPAENVYESTEERSD